MLFLTLVIEADPRLNDCDAAVTVFVVICSLFQQENRFLTHFLASHARNLELGTSGWVFGWV